MQCNSRAEQQCCVVCCKILLYYHWTDPHLSCGAQRRPRRRTSSCFFFIESIWHCTSTFLLTISLHPLVDQEDARAPHGLFIFVGLDAAINDRNKGMQFTRALVVPLTPASCQVSKPRRVAHRCSHPVLLHTLSITCQFSLCINTATSSKYEAGNPGCKRSVIHRKLEFVCATF